MTPPSSHVTLAALPPLTGIDWIDGVIYGVFALLLFTALFATMDDTGGGD